MTVTRTVRQDWSAARTGAQTFTVHNKSAQAGEVNLVNASGGVVAEIETLGPATTAQMTATLGPRLVHVQLPDVRAGRHHFGDGAGHRQGQPGRPGGGHAGDRGRPDRPEQGVRTLRRGAVADPGRAITTIKADLQQGRLSAARTDWLTAQLDWEKVGASYDSFGDDGTAVDGLPDGLVNGVNDKDFTGLHRLEYGLWHGQSAATLLPVVNVLARDVATVRRT